MKGPGWQVEARDAERAREALRDAGALRDTAAVLHENGRVIFSLRGGVPIPVGVPGLPVEREFPPRRVRSPRNYRDALSWPAELAAKLPRSFDVVGDIVLVRVPDDLVPRSEELGRALLEFVPSARLVLRDEGVRGWQRTRRGVRIAGEGPARTLHRENGLAFEVDLDAAYFSPRLGREHARVAAEVRKGDSVLDLCAGIGPFSLTIAAGGRASGIRAVDANPAAIALLESNARRLRVEGRVRAVCADLDTFLPSAEVADRVIFNLPREGIKYLTSVGKSVSPAGTLHYFELTERDRESARPSELVDVLGGAQFWRLADQHVVHPYSPTADVVAYTLARRTE